MTRTSGVSVMRTVEIACHCPAKAFSRVHSSRPLAVPTKAGTTHAAIVLFVPSRLCAMARMMKESTVCISSFRGLYTSTRLVTSLTSCTSSSGWVPGPLWMGGLSI